MTRVLSKHMVARVSALQKRTLYSLQNNYGLQYSSVAHNRNVQIQPVHDDPRLWVKSPHPDIKTVEGVTMQEMVWSKLGKGKDREKLLAFECAITGRKYTFGELYKYARGFGAALMHAGFKKGDVIGIVLPNIPEYGIVMFGALEAGLTVTPVNPAYTSAEIQRQLQNSEVKCAVTIPTFLSSVIESKKTIPGLSHIIVIGESQIDCHSFGDMIKTDSKGVKFFTGKEINTETDVALLPYSSGTTGHPKGVMLTHSNIVNCFQQYNQPEICRAHEYDGGEQERLLGLLPYFHVYGFSALLIMSVHHGASTICLPKFEPDLFIKAIRQHKPTILHLVTPLISFMVNAPEFTENDLESTHSLVAGAAPIGVSLINRILEKARRPLTFQEGYGMTELSPVSHIVPVSAGNTKLGSCGAPVAGTLTKIVDVENGRTLGRNERGEICVKGKQVMKGYYKNEEATKNTIDSDGWLHTGDIAYYDDDGFLYIVDRLKELIKVKGFQVAPSELEDILRKHPDIADVAVIGVPHEEWGELPRAYIVRKSIDLDDNQVNDYMADKVTSFKQLRGGIEYVKAIPKAASGKILRRELVKDFREKMNLK